MHGISLPDLPPHRRRLFTLKRGEIARGNLTYNGDSCRLPLPSAVCCATALLTAHCSPLTVLGNAFIDATAAST